MSYYIDRELEERGLSLQQVQELLDEGYPDDTPARGEPKGPLTTAERNVLLGWLEGLKLKELAILIGVKSKERPRQALGRALGKLKPKPDRTILT